MPSLIYSNLSTTPKAFDFNIFIKNPTSTNSSSIVDIEPTPEPKPVDVFALKDADGKYLFDVDNNKLFVRG